MLMICAPRRWVYIPECLICSNLMCLNSFTRDGSCKMDPKTASKFKKDSTKLLKRKKKPFITFLKPHIMYPIGQQCISRCVTQLLLD